MARILCFVLFVWCFTLADFTDPPCVIDLECAECIPDNMPLVTSHRAANGSIVVASGEEVTLACPGGRFQALPLQGALTARCVAGRLATPDGQLRHLLELGCQESIFEDVLHQVDHCGAPLQGRAYQVHAAAGAGGAHHLAALCYDEDRGVATVAHATSDPRGRLTPPHRDNHAPLTLLGNFNHMFDANTRHHAQTLYSDDVRLNRRLRELLKYERHTFADQTLTSAKLLGGHYFEDQNMRVADFVSNKIAVWKSVASGNLQHLHNDVAKLMKLARPHAALDVYAGTHGVHSLRSAHGRTELFLKPGRFPVPKYVWTVVHDKQNERALAVIVLNDPFVAVSEIKDRVFCESVCGRVSWLRELRRNRNYETPVYGLVFCCNVHNFTNIVTEMPKQVLRNVSDTTSGVLREFFI